MSFSTDASALAYARPQRPTPLIVEAPTLGSPGWIPEGTGWSLDDLRADHDRLRGQIVQTIEEASEIRDRFEAEDVAYQDAVRQGFRDGVKVEAPTLTPPEQRRELLDAADQRNALACEALDDFLREAIGQIETEASGWLGELGTVREAASAKREEAARLLAEATAEVNRVGRLEEWIKRNSGTHERAAFRLTGTRYVGWGFICEHFTPSAQDDSDGLPRLVDTHDPEKFAKALNTGVSRPIGAVEPRNEMDAWEEAHGIESPDPQTAEERREELERRAAEVDGRPWNPGNSGEVEDDE